MRIANDRPGQRILEVGVGTGLSLPHFRSDLRVTGIDVSAEMLEKGKRRTERMGLAHVEGLHLMDAENLEFPDNTFDAVLALYVASVVPDPARFAAEMRRVCIPGGTIVVVNHFTSENPLARFMEKRLGTSRPAYRLSRRFSVRGLPAGEPAVYPRSAAEQSFRLLEAVALRQRKARIKPQIADSKTSGYGNHLIEFILRSALHNIVASEAKLPIPDETIGPPLFREAGEAFAGFG